MEKYKERSILYITRRDQYVRVQAGLENQVTISRIYTSAQRFSSSIRVIPDMLQLNPPSLLWWFLCAHTWLSINALGRGWGFSGPLERIGTDALAPLRGRTYTARIVVGSGTRSGEVFDAHSRARCINGVDCGRIRDCMLAGCVGEETVRVGEGDALELEVVLLHWMERHLLVKHCNRAVPI